MWCNAMYVCMYVRTYVRTYVCKCGKNGCFFFCIYTYIIVSFQIWGSWIVQLSIDMDKKNKIPTTVLVGFQSQGLVLSFFSFPGPSQNGTPEILEPLLRVNLTLPKKHSKHVPQHSNFQCIQIIPETCKTMVWFNP